MEYDKISNIKYVNFELCNESVHNQSCSENEKSRFFFLWNGCHHHKKILEKTNRFSVFLLLLFLAQKRGTF